MDFSNGSQVGPYSGVGERAFDPSSPDSNTIGDGEGVAAVRAESCALARWRLPDRRHSLFHCTFCSGESVFGMLENPANDAAVVVHVADNVIQRREAV